jgi:hypothetical protein
MQMGESYKNGCSRKGLWGGDWIDLAQDRDRWWELVTTVMKLGFHKTRNFLTT